MPPTSFGPRRSAGRIRLGFSAAFVSVLIAACSSAATPTPIATVAAATSTPTPSALPTATPTPTAIATPTDTAVATPTPTPVAVHATPAPVARRLCTGPELRGAIMIWHTLGGGGVQGDFFVGPLTSTSGGRLCYMRGTSEGQMVAAGAVIADSGASSAGVRVSDAFLPVDAGGRIYGSVTWSNWCPKGPSQPVTVALVLPNHLGRVVLNTSGPTPVPSCVSSGSPTSVTSTSWRETYP